MYLKEVLIKTNVFKKVYDIFKIKLQYNFIKSSDYRFICLSRIDYMCGLLQFIIFVNRNSSIVFLN